MIVPTTPQLSTENETRTYNALSRLLKIGAIFRCKPCSNQFLSSYFLRQKSSGEDRFILNLKKLNKFIPTSHFKIEDLKTAISLINKNFFMAVIDLIDAYLMVTVTEEHRKFLRFAFRDETYEFQSLLFGLCTAPYIFTKLLKPVVHQLRCQGIILVIYLDDILIIAKSEAECRKHVHITRKLLESLGFMISESKSQLQPAQRCIFLGLVLDTKKFRIELPDKKRLTISKLVDRFLKNKECKIQDLAKLIGTLVAACPAVKYGWLHTKRLEREKYLALIESNDNYNSKITLPNIIQPDLEWWAEKIRNSFNPIRKNVYSKEIYTDASLTGWGAFCEGEKAYGLWTEAESNLHINALELIAAFFGLKCFAKEMHNREILLRMDNTTGIAYVNRMGGIQYPRLTQISREIWDWCESHELYIHASYLPSKENKEADEGSRMLPQETEWELASWAFRKIERILGPFEIDLFASRANAKCKKYVSWQRDPDSFNIDAFTINWNQYSFYAFPPFSVILRVLQKIQTDKATGVVVEDASPASKPHVDSCQIIRESFQRNGATKEAAEVMLQSIAKSTLRQYAKPIRLWSEFCAKESIELYNYDISKILQFFTEILNQTKSYSTVNVYRAALSLIMGNKLGEDNRVSRFFKGAATQLPKTYKYDVTWDPDLVLNHLEKWYPNENLTLQLLTKKLVTLLALITAQRVQTLSAIQLENISLDRDTIRIKITENLKTSTRSKFQPILEMPTFTEKPQICAASTLRAYITKTENLRSGKSSAGKLLLTHKKPHHPATAQTISRWIRETLEESGIDTKIFTAHSTRHASTSAAARRSTNIEVIRRAAGWSAKSSTFARFYNRPVTDNGTFASFFCN
ncbi:uncharacterized protein LOC127286471 [Leptopilina boulardi]|uniref:uncharacterized protein LOC127286471 n=1 Tax=Leptopilina boulardi TaxID=63433 RepID=UPI0021F5F1C7|nr:uncharacterized protein LOC127286471 [Leptopilina boulardi]